MQRAWASNQGQSSIEDDAMDIDDERILSDVTILRASNWQISSESPFEDSAVHEDGINYFVVLDSNVLISYLPLVQQLLAAIIKQNLRMALCLPSVVVAELNFLKERNPNPNTRALAQAANGWLLAQVRSRTRAFRGQQKHETMKDEQQSKKVNDDRIVDYCEYLLSKVSGSGGVVSLLSNDHNCCLKAELQGITSISPKPRSSVEALLPSMMGKGNQPTSGPSTSEPEHRQPASDQGYVQYATKSSGAFVDASMDLDDDLTFVSPSEAHPMTILHREFLEHLSNLLPHLAYDAALQEQARRERTGETLQKPVAPKKTALYASIHAPKSAEANGAMRAFVMPSVKDVQSWTALDCIHFALEFPPSKDGEKPKSFNRRPPSIGILKLFLLRHDQPGGRKGKDWSMGDWAVALKELEQVAVYCDWQTVHECRVCNLEPPADQSGPYTADMARRGLIAVLTILALFLLGTLVVLSSISFYLHIDNAAYLEDEEIFRLERYYDDHKVTKADEKIPRIIHQTWKTDILPDRWRIVSQGCKDLMPDYEYMLWTDESSREFIEAHYPWFLDTFDGYTYPIQRADAIRYFVLHHYGGVYMDLDVGCMRRVDPLLQYEVVLPKTIPVGVSNDLMFAAKGHPFMEQTIRHLINFDHSWIINYPTVMFSTGPMFLSAQYGIYTAAHPPTPENPGGDVRILPKSLYGKNARVDEAPKAFFSHHYGSSWHADDAAFITFLGRWGMRLMWIGFAVLLFGMIRLLIQKNGTGKGRSLRRRLANARYYLLLPRRVPARGSNITLDIIAPGEANEAPEPSSIMSPTSSRPGSPTSTMPLLPYSFEAESSTSSSASADEPQSLGATAADALRRAGVWARSHVSGGTRPRGHRGHTRSWGSASDMLFFLPAILPTRTVPTPARSSSATNLRSHSRSHSRARSKSALSDDDIEANATSALGVTSPPPPPYAEGRTPSTAGEWPDWSPNIASSSNSAFVSRQHNK